MRQYRHVKTSPVEEGSDVEHPELSLFLARTALLAGAATAQDADVSVEITRRGLELVRSQVDNR